MVCIQAALIASLFSLVPEADEPNVELDLRICGPVAMWLVLEELGVGLPLDEILSGLPRRGTDSSFTELASFAEARRLVCRAVEWREIPPFTEHECPAIIPVATVDRRRHFIALLAAKDGAVKVQNSDSQELLRAK